MDMYGCVTMKKDEKQDEKVKSEEEKIKNDKDNKEKHIPMTDQEAKQLAEDMYKGLVFTDRHVQRKEDIPGVFMPLALMDSKFVEELQKNPPGMIYEYMDKAGPMAMNGMPMFLSCRMISIDDAKKVFERYNKIREAIESV